MAVKESCVECFGSGKLSSGTYFGTCGDCRGAGYTLREAADHEAKILVGESALSTTRI